jgi:hypothetical protein
MTTVLDDDFANIAAEFSDVLVDATLITYETTYNPTTGTNARTATSTSVKVSPPVPVAAKLADGTLNPHAIAESILPIPLAGLAVIPRQGAELTIAGQTFSISRVDTLWTGELKRAYQLYLRGS